VFFFAYLTASHLVICVMESIKGQWLQSFLFDYVNKTNKGVHIVTHDKIMRTEGKLQVRTISISWEQHVRLQNVAKASGLKVVELHRMALANLLNYVAEKGSLPTPNLSGGDAQ